jgi:hypothetical protein
MTLARHPVAVGLLFAGAVLWLIAGCATTNHDAGPDVTGGLRLEMFIDSGDGSYTRYLVKPDGQISFGGGWDARNRDYTWSGPLTDDEIHRLLALIAEYAWFDRDWPRIGRGEGRTTDITVRQGGRRRSFRVAGEDPAVMPIEELLATAAARRHEEFLRTLPKPGLRDD